MKLANAMNGRVGGPVGENNFKFFLQFTGYAAVYTLHVLVVMSVYIWEQRTSEVGMCIFLGFHYCLHENRDIQFLAARLSSSKANVFECRMRQ